VKLFGRKVGGFPKTLLALVALLLVASGLCGVTYNIEAMHGWTMYGRGLPRNAVGATLGWLDVVGMCAIGISIIGILSVLVIWPVYAISKRWIGPSKDGIHNVLDKNVDGTDARNDKDDAT
jgi:hypothetical protein